MNNKKFLKTLEGMRGKTFQYGNSIHYIVDFKIDDEKEICVIQTNLSFFDRPFESVEEFLKYWKPASNLATLQTEENQNKQVAVFLEQEDSLSNKLIGILTDNIEKVKTDKTYISQAQTINNNINTIVNITKIRLTYAKLSFTTKTK